jgi:hypothetical protein
MQYLVVRKTTRDPEVKKLLGWLTNRPRKGLLHNKLANWPWKKPTSAGRNVVVTVSYMYKPHTHLVLAGIRTKTIRRSIKVVIEKSEGVVTSEEKDWIDVEVRLAGTREQIAKGAKPLSHLAFGPQIAANVPSPPSSRNNFIKFGSDDHNPVETSNSTKFDICFKDRCTLNPDCSIG